MSMVRGMNRTGVAPRHDRLTVTRPDVEIAASLASLLPLRLHVAPYNTWLHDFDVRHLEIIMADPMKHGRSH